MACLCLRARRRSGRVVPLRWVDAVLRHGRRRSGQTRPVGGAWDGGGGAARPRPGARSRLFSRGLACDQTIGAAVNATAKIVAVAWNPANAQGWSCFCGAFEGVSSSARETAGPWPVQITRLRPCSGAIMYPVGMTARTRTAISAMANHALQRLDGLDGDFIDGDASPRRL